MNIFYLDTCPTKSARMMTNKHVVKMIVESAQLLSTAHHVLDGASAMQNIYKKTHVNHPCAVWVRESDKNYEWLCEHLNALLIEYGARYNKRPNDHATFIVYERLKTPPVNIPRVDTTPFRIAISNKACIVENDVVLSYRNYYVADKLKTDDDKKRYDYLLTNG